MKSVFPVAVIFSLNGDVRISPFLVEATNSDEARGLALRIAEKVRGDSDNFTTRHGELRVMAGDDQIVRPESACIRNR